MSYCSSCGHQVDNDSVFCPVCGNRVGVVVRVQHQEPPTPPYQQDKQLPFKPNSCMGLAVFTTLCCCLIFGIYAMVLAGQVDTLYYSGHYREAEMKAADAKKWSIIGIVLGIACYIFIIIYIIALIIVTDGDLEEMREILE